MPRSYSRSNSRSRSRSRTSPSRRSRSPLRTNNDQDIDDINNCRLHVADLSSNCSKRQIEKAFEKWPLIEVWHAQASCFAFVVLKNHEDVQAAISELDGRFIGEARVRVSLARPRIRSSGGGGGSGRRYFDQNKRCFQCGERGHFSRDCGNEQRSKKRSNNGYRSRSRSRERQRKRSYSRSRSPRPRIIREYRRHSPRRSSPPARSSYRSRDNGSGYYSSPPRT